jgi:4'-phosphopantetheinyl transferase EntD
MARADGGILGVGMDVEEVTRFARLGAPAVRRAAGRWLSPAERAWWRRQSSPAEALVVALSCKEAAFKAWSGGGWVQDVRLRLDGDAERGHAVALGGAVAVRVEWWRWEDRIVAVAVAQGREGGRVHPEAVATGLTGSPMPSTLPTFRIVTRIFRDFALSFGSP